MAIVLLQLGLFLFWTYALRNRWLSPIFTCSCLLSIFGCLVHAKRDFPFQTYGVFFTFIVVCALLNSAVTAPRVLTEPVSEPSIP